MKNLGTCRDVLHVYNYNEIDKNTPTFCQKHRDYLFGSGRSDSTLHNFFSLYMMLYISIIFNYNMNVKTRMTTSISIEAQKLL